MSKLNSTTRSKQLALFAVVVLLTLLVTACGGSTFTDASASSGFAEPSPTEGLEKLGELSVQKDGSPWCDTGVNIIKNEGELIPNDITLTVQSHIGEQPMLYGMNDFDGLMIQDGYTFVLAIRDNVMILEVWAPPGTPNCIAKNGG